MSKHTRWLNAEIERWVAENIVSGEQAARIRARYAEPAGGLSWGLIVFFGLGAAIVGLGVILLFAYNWDAISKFWKLALIFAAIGAAHVGGLQLQRHTDWRVRLGEALSLLGTMGFGAGIWLIAQIYHIDEHFPNGFLIWALGALAMAWAIGSVAQGVLAAVLVAWWSGVEVLGFRTPVEFTGLIMLGGLAPLAWRLRSAVLLTAVVAAWYWVLLCHAAHWGGSGVALTNAFALAALLLGLGRLLPAERPEAERKVLAFLGMAGFVFCAYLLTFEGAARSLLRTREYAGAGTALAVYRWALFAVAAAAWGWVLSRALGKRLAIDRELWLVPIGLVYVQLLALAGGSDGWFAALVFNVICLALAAAWMVRGCREGALRPTVLGSVLLALVVFARYFDLFDSLAVRGAVFVVFGSVLFAEGFYYRKLRRAEAAEGGAA